jgi:hypothetical protein
VLARNSDRDQVIGSWQDLQIGGPSSRSIDRLSASIGVPLPKPGDSLSDGIKLGHLQIKEPAN